MSVDRLVHLIAEPGLRAANAEKGIDVVITSVENVGKAPPSAAALHLAPSTAPMGYRSAEQGGAENRSAESRSAEYLLTAVGDGDRKAFDELYLMFGGRVLGLAAKVVLDREQAKEVTQDVFLQLWQQASRFDPARGSASSWILRVTHARAVDRVRLSRNRSTRDSRYAVGNHVPDMDTVMESVLIAADRSAVRVALLKLTPLQRESVLLAYFGGLSTGEIAVRIGVLRATVKTRIRDGLLRLATELTASAAPVGVRRGRS